MREIWKIWKSVDLHGLCRTIVIQYDRYTHKILPLGSFAVAQDGDFFACLDCTLYRGDRSGCGDHTENPIVFLKSNVFPPEKVNNNIIFYYAYYNYLSVSLRAASACGQPTSINAILLQVFQQLDRREKVVDLCFRGLVLPVGVASLPVYTVEVPVCFSADLP